MIIPFLANNDACVITSHDKNALPWVGGVEGNRGQANKYKLLDIV